MTKTNNLPEVTIGIPTYNRAATYLRESLASALAQSYPRLEIVVSDNCSSDGTRDYVESLNDSRLRYIRHEDPLPPEKNAQYCIREARGTYFILLHDDDVLDEDFIETCISALDGREAGLVHTGVRKIDTDGYLIKIRRNPHGRSTLFEYFDAVIRGEAVTYFCNTLYHTETLRRVGGFHSRCYAFQDVIANIRVAHLRGRVEIEEPKSSYRIHGSKLGSTHSICNWCDDSLEIIDVMCELMPERKDYFRREGIRLMCEKNYAKKVRRVPMPIRLYAYYVVYRKFGYAYSPVSFFAERARKLWRADPRTEGSKPIGTR